MRTFLASDIILISGILYRYLNQIRTDRFGRVGKPAGLLAARQRRQLLKWNDTATDYPRDKCVHELFAAQVERTPDAVAVVFEDQQLTYGELNVRANQLAQHLRALGVGPEILVGLSLKRSLDLIVGILGVLKAGGAYVPLDVNYPQQRLEFMLQDAAIQLLVTTTDLRDKLPPTVPTVICLDAEREKLQALDARELTPFANSQNLAHVIYTSGSTGLPKGVLIQHSSIVRLVVANDYATFGPDRVFLQLAPISFDASTFEIWGALLHGAKLVLAPNGLPDFAELERVIKQHRVTTLWLTASLFNQVVEHAPGMLSAVEQVLTGGEALSVQHVRMAQRKLPRSVQLINGYGPTESTTFTTCYAIRKRVAANAGSIPIGRPIANTQTFVLDEGLKPSPIGVWGELYIGGDGLARGYLNRPELTAERFIANPQSSDPPSRLYRTGDCVRWLKNGNLEFQGRLDGQVKLRGFRIELGEIESALCEHAEVAHCAVILREDRPGDKRLVAYWVPRSASGRPELRSYLSQRLPDYMVPTAFVQVESLPLTTNGKLDRSALLASEQRQSERNAGYVAPRDATEVLLAGIWSEVLGIQQISVCDNFFSLGGHSLSALQIAARVSANLAVEVRPSELFDAPTIGELAIRIAELRSSRPHNLTPPLVPIDRQTRNQFSLSFAQERMWFLEQFEESQGAYNSPYAFCLEGALDVEALRRALEAIVHRHEPLRATVRMIERQLTQIIQPPAPFILPLVDLSGLPPEMRDKETAEFIQVESGRRFDLEHDLMLRASLVRRSACDHVLIVVAHHIAWDGWSQQLFMRELSALYDAYHRKVALCLPTLSVQYVDYVEWQRGSLRSERIECCLKYWRQQLDGLTPLELPTDFPRPAVHSNKGKVHCFDIDPILTQKLEGVSRDEGVTLHMTLLAAFELLLGRSSGQEDFAVGMPITRRDHPALEPQIGLFVNTLVIRANLAGQPTFRELLRRVRETTLAAHDHKDLPFGHLVKEFRPERHIDRNPLVPVMFQLLHVPDDGPTLAELKVSRLPEELLLVPLDLHVQLWARSHGVRGEVFYKTDLFDAVTIEKLSGQFLAILAALVADPDRSIDEPMPSGERSERERRSALRPRMFGGKRGGNRAVASRVRPPQSTDRNYVAPRSGTEQVLAEVWQTELNVPRIGIDDNFFELGGHSLLAARLFITLEKRIGRRLPLAWLFAAPNIRLLAEKIDREESLHAGVTIVPLRNTGSRPPLFLMPSITGSPFSWKELADNLSSEQPIFAVGLAGNVSPWSDRATLPQIASHFTAALRSANITGPLHVMGHSFGGMLAYEVARQLSESGVQVGLVVVVDTGPEQLRISSPWNVLRHFPAFVNNLPQWISHFFRQTTMPHKISEVRRKLRGWRRLFWARVTGQRELQRLDGVFDTRRLPEVMRKNMETNFDALQFYEPGTYAGKLALFRATIRPMFNGFTPDLHWNQVVTGGVEVIDIPGNHMSILGKPQSDVLSARLQSILDRP